MDFLSVFFICLMQDKFDHYQLALFEGDRDEPHELHCDGSRPD